MSRTRFALIALALLAASPSAYAADPTTAKVLTNDALGFVHVRVANIWSSDAAKHVRAFAEKAGPALINEFDSRFVPAPSEIESFTVVLYDPNFRDLLPIGRVAERTPVWVITSKKPLNRVDLLKTMTKDSSLKKHNGREYYFDERYWSGMLILDERTYAYASEDSITALIDSMAKGGDSPLAAMSAREADKHAVTVGVNVAQLVTPDLLKVAPEALHPMLKAKTWFATLDLNNNTMLAVTMEYGTPAQAKDGLKAAQEGIQIVRGLIAGAVVMMEQKAKKEPGKPQVGIQEFPEQVMYLIAVAGLKNIDAVLSSIPIEANGTTVRATLGFENILVGGNAGLPLTVLATIAGITSLGSNANATFQSIGESIGPGGKPPANSIAVAIEKYHKDKGQYPPPAILDKDGKPLLSWRVAILPYMDYAYIPTRFGDKRIDGPKQLYEMFKLDEPWDGPNNRKLIDKMPSLYDGSYAIPYSLRQIGRTGIVAVVGKGAIFDPTKEVSNTLVRDGLEQTLLLLSLEEADQAVYWTKPADIALTDKGALPADGPKLSKRFRAIYADGREIVLPNGLAEKVFLGIVTRDGGEKLDENVIRPEPPKLPPPPK